MKTRFYLARRFEVKADLVRAKKGTFVELRVDSNGVPLDEFWRERFKDGDIKLSEKEEKIEYETKKDEIQKNLDKKSKN